MKEKPQSFGVFLTLFLVASLSVAAPKEARLLAEIQAPILAGDRQIGSVKLPPGTPITILSVTEDAVMVSWRGGSPFRIPRQCILPSAPPAAASIPAAPIAPAPAGVSPTPLPAALRAEQAQPAEKDTAVAPPRVAAPGFVQREGNRLFLNGRVYRAIGVNIPYLSQVYMGTWGPNVMIYGGHEKAKQAIIEAVEDAARNGFAYIRFFASPGYPIDMDRIYYSDPSKYWKLMDEVIGICRKNRIKAVPSLNAMPGFFANYCGEHKQAILDRESRTSKAAYNYIREFVSRYKDDPTILMWELQNEVMHKADIDFEGKPALAAGLFTGNRQPYPTLTREDSLTWAMILQIYKEQAAFIKGIDPHHLVTSGDCHVRYECTSRRETFPKFKFRDDTFEEWVDNNLKSQPPPLDVLSLHLAASTDPKERWGMQKMVWMKKFLFASVASGVPVYLGELGQDKPSYQDDPTAKPACELIDMAEEAGVSLMSLWVWHFLFQPDRSLTSQSHPELIKRCAEFNRKYACFE